MQVSGTEWLVTFSGSSAFFSAFVKNSPILFFPRGARLYHTGSAGFLLWFIVRKTGRKASRVSSFLQDDGWRTLDTNELALNTSLERCKCTWLVHSAILRHPPPSFLRTSMKNLHSRMLSSLGGTFSKVLVSPTEEQYLRQMFRS